MTLLCELKISYHQPGDLHRWNELCCSCGNLQQSTYYDEVQYFFNQHPVYLEIWQGNRLVGGSKIYVYTPQKYKWLSAHIGKYLLQAGEAILCDDFPRDTVFPLLIKGFEEIHKREGAAWYTSYGYFDKPELLLFPNQYKAKQETAFANAFVKLEQPVDQLWAGIHPHHQRKITTAEKRGYHFEPSNDIEGFLALLAKTYEHQSKDGPNPLFVKNFYRVMRKEHLAQIFGVSKDSKLVSAVLLTFYGRVAYYAYGGAFRSKDGASHLLHWKVIQYLAEKNYSKYFLGQVAVDDKSGDKKFLLGISTFKRRFGISEVVSSRKTFIFKPISYQLWKKIIFPLAAGR